MTTDTEKAQGGNPGPQTSGRPSIPQQRTPLDMDSTIYPETTSLDIARALHGRGYAVVPIPAGKKSPTGDEWQRLRITENDLPRFFCGGPRNVGVLLGEPSNGLVDVDLDVPEAELLADEFLPKTPAEFGRPSKPRSHRLYYCADINATVRLRAPRPDASTLGCVRKATR